MALPGRFVVVCGDGEYIIHTALNLRNKSFGSALDFVWASNGEYAIRETSSKVKVFKNFKEKLQIALDYSAECIFGGTLLAIKGGSALSFYSWETGDLIRYVVVERTCHRSRRETKSQVLRTGWHLEAWALVLV
jgi:coatomer subunit beta'